MSDLTSKSRWRGLDKDLNRIGHVERANAHVARSLLAPGLALAFIVLAGLLATLAFGRADSMLVVAAAAGFGAYMAINIGANDVANNMGPVVGAKALTMGAAITIAAIAESAGALLAGSDVVSTISQGIIDPNAVQEGETFVWAMMAALISAALWVNLATWIRAPVSTTHSIVGGVMGAGVAAAGLGSVDWAVTGMIAASWVITPALGGMIAAALLALVRTLVQNQTDKIAAARRWVPVLVGVMGGAFAAYMILKTSRQIQPARLDTALTVGVLAGLAIWGVAVPWVRTKSQTMDNRMRSLKTLFNLPLVFAATLLSFAHGANDVANAVGPLAGIVHVVRFQDAATQVAVPHWVMIIGASGISFGLFLFGPKLIGTVGRKITRLNPVRAFCVALSAAITVLVASGMGLPVSSTHVAVGAVFGVGFYREWSSGRRRPDHHHRPRPRLAFEELQRRKLVRRSYFLTVIAAWVVTVPAAAAMSAVIFLVLNAAA